MRHVGQELGLVLAGGFELAVRHLQLREQPHIFDSDHRLITEGLQEVDLGGREPASLAPRHQEGADRFTVAYHRYPDGAPKTEEPTDLARARKRTSPRCRDNGRPS